MLPAVETIPKPRGASFESRAFVCDAFPFFWHLHPEHELTLITGGRGQRFVGDHIEPFTVGEVVLIASDVPHSWRGDADGPRCSAVVTQFRDDALGGDFFDLPELTPVRQLLREAEHGLVFRDAALSARLERLPQRAGARRLTGLLDVLLLLTETAGRRLCESPANRGMREGDRRRIDAACRLLNENYLDEISLTEVAVATGLTPSATCRMFRRLMGRTVVSYLHELRVAHACRLLAETDDPVTDVCFDSGFGNVAHFNRVFRRLRDASPRQFRAALRRS